MSVNNVRFSLILVSRFSPDDICCAVVVIAKLLASGLQIMRFKPVFDHVFRLFKKRQSAQPMPDTCDFFQVISQTLFVYLFDQLTDIDSKGIIDNNFRCETGTRCIGNYRRRVIPPQHFLLLPRCDTTPNIPGYPLNVNQICFAPIV